MAHLTVVALKVIVLVHRHDPEDLFTALRHKTKGKNVRSEQSSGKHVFDNFGALTAAAKNKSESTETSKVK